MGPPIADALDTATWGLVLATALLVVATAIPALGAIIQMSAERRRRAAEIIPDIHMLRGRLNQQVGWLSADSPSSIQVVDGFADNARELLTMLARLLDLAPGHGLKFTNELYVCRHLLSQAMYEIEKAIQEAAEEDSEFALVPADRLERAVRLTVAGKITLVAAEALLPAKSQSIDGENFWDRFTRVAHEREQGAEQQRMRDRGR